MTFTIMYLVKNPDKLAKLRKELDLATASNGPGALPTYDQIRNLPYLTGCINESLRLRPVAATGKKRGGFFAFFLCALICDHYVQVCP